MLARASHPPAGTAKGFTLVELLVVVLILTVVAAIVVPQITASVDDAQLAALDADLARLRNAIELYRQEHGVYPGSRASAGGSCAGRGGTGTTASAATRAAAVAEQLTLYSSNAGKVCSIASPSYRYGPYLKSAEPGEAGVPANPITASNAIVVVATGDLALASASTGGGWLYDVVSGRLLADHVDYDHR